MPRQSKPYFRAQTQSYYCSINGKQVPLGKTKTEAFDKFHKLMAGKDDFRTESSTVYKLTQTYLDWCQTNRKSDTYKKHLHYLKSFVESAGKKLRVGELRKHHLTKWLDGKTWASTSKNDAVGIVKRAINWAVEEGYFSHNPIAHVGRPRRKRREIFYTPDQWGQIKSHATGPILDFLDFLWLTGCRPKEARDLEARHIKGDLVIFAVSESKGEKHERVIYLTEDSKAILNRLVLKYPSGPLFRNRRGRKWTRDAVKCVLNRISKKVNFRVIAYGARHAYATNALMNGTDSISVAHLMGHRSTAMVATVYSHLANNHAYLLEQAKNASPARVAKSDPASPPESPNNDGADPH